MEIERINEDTVKFFLSYSDIEERGFTREEIWNNRERSEELFWEMMDEINEQSEFAIEGPLWIQVHSQNNGIEVTVTRAAGEHDHMFSPSIYNEDINNIFKEQANGTFESIEDIFRNNLTPDGEWLENTFLFKEFEDVIQIASRMHHFKAATSLYVHDNEYYLHVQYDAEEMTNEDKTNLFSVLSEFARPAEMTIHMLQEYGKVIFESDVFSQVETYFNS